MYSCIDQENINNVIMFKVLNLSSLNFIYIYIYIYERWVQVKPS